MRNKSKGSSALFNLILLALLGYGVYVLYVYGKIELDRRALVSDITEAVAGRVYLSIPQLKERVLKVAEKRNVDIDPDSVYIEKSKDTIHVEFTYYVEKNMLLWHLDKEIFVSLDLPAVAGL